MQHGVRDKIAGSVDYTPCSVAELDAAAAVVGVGKVEIYRWKWGVDLQCTTPKQLVLENQKFIDRNI